MKLTSDAASCVVKFRADLMAGSDIGFRHRRVPASGGFTIVEVMIAAVILALVFVGAIPVISAGAHLNKTSGEINLASQILQDQLEQLRLRGYADVNSSLVGVSTWTPPTRFTEDSDATWECARAISAHGSQSALLLVRLTVRWTHGGRSPHTHERSYATYLAEGGLSESLF